MDTSKERAAQPRIAVIGEVDGELARALGRVGADVKRGSLHALHRLEVEHVVLVGPAAVDGGAVAVERAPKNARVYVVLPESAAGARLEAVRLGATIVPASDNPDLLAEQIVGQFDAPSDRLGWVEVGGLMDAVRDRLIDEVSGPQSRRVQLSLGSGERVLGAVQRFVDELVEQTREVRDGGTLGPRIAVDELTWDDDPQTLERGTPQAAGPAPAIVGGSGELGVDSGSAEVLRFPEPAFGGLPSPRVPLPPPRGRRPPDPDLHETAPRDAMEVEQEVIESFRLEDKEAEPPAPEDVPTAEHEVPPDVWDVPSEPSSPAPASSLPPPPEPSSAGLGAAPAAAPRRSAAPWILLGVVVVILLGAIGLAAWMVLGDALGEVEERLASEEPLSASHPGPARAPELPAAPEPAAAPAASAPGGGEAEPAVASATGDGEAEPAVAPAPAAEAAPAVEPEPEEDEEPPADPRARSDELVEQGLAAERAQNWDAAREAYEQALEIMDSNPHAVAGLARERLTAGDPQGALRYAERAVRLRRRRAAYHVLLGDARRMAGNQAGARRAYERALDLDENDRDARRRLGL